MNEPIKTNIIDKIPFFENDSFIKACENSPTKIGVVIVNVAIKYAGKYW